MLDSLYHLFSSTTRSLKISISDNKLTFIGNDYGSYCEEVWGRDEYEFYYELDEENTYSLLRLLMNKYEIEDNLETILKNEFGCDEGSILFDKFCKENGIQYSFHNY